MGYPVAMQTNLDGLVFDNRFVEGLPADPQKMNLTRPVREACYSFANPTPVAAPKVVAYSREVLASLDLDESVVDERFARVFGGNEILDGMQPFAMAYGGHQFGNWAGQLGDGRAINLGQVLGSGGQSLTLQLKGAGPTPFSRTADGRAVMRSSVREFICSEAMFHLGVPTTRALSLVSTGDSIARDMFYDGNVKDEPGAVVCRVSPSFVRFGSFELPASRGETDVLRQLAEHTIRNHFGHLVPRDDVLTKDTYVEWFREVAETTAQLIVHWGRVGFVHGVMNTDNMSILGQTIDYGPYGWLEDYDPEWTPNTTDASGRRYAFGKQSRIAMWNLAQLGNAIFPLVEDAAPLQAVIEHYSDVYSKGWRSMMAGKLGLEELRGEADLELVQDLLRLIGSVETDMTIFFRGLAPSVPGQPVGVEDLEGALYQPAKVPSAHREELGAWLARYHGRIADEGSDDLQRAAGMNGVNPKYVLRNYLAQLAIDKAETGDGSLVVDLLDVLRNPYDEQPGKQSFAERRPEWARDRPGCSMLSCSS